MDPVPEDGNRPAGARDYKLPEDSGERKSERLKDSETRDSEVPADSASVPALAEDDGPRLFDLLTDEGRELVPLHYQLFERRPPRSGVPQRIAASAWYHAPSFSCFPFHKPISRCRRYDEP